MLAVTADGCSHGAIAVTAIVSTLLLLVGFLATSVIKRRDNDGDWPKVPGSLPLIGNLLSVGATQNLRGRMEEWADKFGQEKGVYEFHLMGVRYIVACRADIVMEVMSQRPFKIRRDRGLAASASSVGGDGVFNAEGDAWKADRRVFAPALNKRHVQDYLPTVKLVAKRLVEKWATLSNQGGSVVINYDLYKYAMDIISLVAFGRDFDTLRHDDNSDARDVNNVLNFTLTRALSPVKYYNIPFIGQYLDGAGWCIKRVLKSFDKLVEEYESSLHDKYPLQGSDHNPPMNTFLAKVVAWSKKEDAAVSRRRLVGNLLTMFFGGTDSNAASMATSLWQIADDRTGLQDELAAEAESLGDLETASLDDVLLGLPRLRSFYHELLRVMGPFPFIMLQTHEEVHFAGTRLPQGINVICLTGYISTHPPRCDGDHKVNADGGASPYLEIPLGPNGEGPADFCPRRWLVQSSPRHATGQPVTFEPPKNTLGGFMSFGHGLRICPGKDLAESMALVMLASVLRSFEISREDNDEIKLVTNFSESPDKEIKLALKPRETR